jgi:hypothetical protein
MGESQTPATTTIKARTNRSGCLDVKNFILCTGINQTELISLRDDPSHPWSKSGSRWPKKNSKKLRKKLASPWPLPLDRNSGDKQPRLAVQKKVKKSEKKACQHIRNLITLPKPNQTNGETND